MTTIHEPELPEVGDWIDAAVKREQDQLDDALEAQRLADPTLGKTVADSSWHCHGCGDPIPPGRRAAVPGVTTCVLCQEAIEHVPKGWRP